jgi:hypothetical protein
MGLLVDSIQQPLINREELKVSQGNSLYSSDSPFTGDDTLNIL